MWITVDVERVLRVDRGINVILCNPMLGSGGPQTLVLKLKGSEMKTPDEPTVIRKREPVAFITKAGLANFQAGTEPESHVLLRTGNDLRVALYTDVQQVDRSWACAARKQALPEPAECNWPVCGCDPYADKVIAALEESGSLTEPQQSADEVQRLRSALENIADWRNVNISGEYEHGLRDIIRSIIDCAVDALDAPQVPRPAPQGAPLPTPANLWRDAAVFPVPLSHSTEAPQVPEVSAATGDEPYSRLPLQYEDGPDYCTVKDAQGRDFALTMQPELMRAMERALREDISRLSQPPVTPTEPQEPSGSDVAVCAECGVNWGTTTARKFGIDNYCNNCESRRGSIRAVPQRSAGGERELRECLSGCAQILDVVKQEWSVENAWTEWDQSVRDSITAAVRVLNGASAALSPTCHGCGASFDPNCTVCGGLKYAKGGY